jgi:c(7)-type cytochrome triheme protein
MRKLHVFLVVLAGVMFSVTQTVVAAPEIIGAPKCKICHMAKTGDQWKIWTESAHARAFETLASEKSRKIAADKGLGDPQQEYACLKCHATRASLGEGVVINEKANYTDDEGVGCEACHGPGSDYKSKNVMLDPEASRAAGLIMNTGCRKCHNQESPTFKGFDFEARWLEIAHPVSAKADGESQASPTLDEAGSLEEILIESSVGNVIFPHDFHVTGVKMECVECHHQIHAVELDTPHPDYLESSWISCQACHNPKSASDQVYYQCGECHHTNPNNIADETLSSKVVVHKSCWKCHDTRTGVEASQGCVDCHVKEEK